MTKGTLRAKIMDECEDCPDEFQAHLKEWVDELESRVGSALDLLDISSISDLDKIEDARSELEELKDALW